MKAKRLHKTVLCALAAMLMFGVSCGDDSGDSGDYITYYTVSFDSNGGDYVPQQSVQSGRTAVEPRSPTRDDYVFDAWYNGVGVFDFSTPVTANLTLTAHWTYIGDDMPPNEDNSNTTNYIVSFNTNGGTFVAPQSVASGTTAVEPDAPTRDGYTFNGWYSGNTPFDFSTLITADLTLTAHWIAATNPDDTPPSEDDNTTICKIYPQDIYNTDFERDYGLFYTIRLLGAWNEKEMEALNDELRAIFRKNIYRYITLDLTQMTGTNIISNFYDCNLLVSVKIGGSVTEIGNGAFSGCNSLESITIGNSVTSIGSYAFSHCEADTITFTGTLQQWNNIYKDVDWNYYRDISRVICSDYTAYY
ncbi:MAG: InlB B-repeat-containing protein [Treponema sp.]|nr:InlB B-repeat-containing protein [Treponema sp.]